MLGCTPPSYLNAPLCPLAGLGGAFLGRHLVTGFFFNDLFFFPPGFQSLGLHAFELVFAHVLVHFAPAVVDGGFGKLLVQCVAVFNTAVAMAAGAAYGFGVGHFLHGFGVGQQGFQVAAAQQHGGGEHGGEKGRACNHGGRKKRKGRGWRCMALYRPIVRLIERCKARRGRKKGPV
ncbi:MAG: hypothetical protein IPH37_03210 [Burkholderiales bacterium]|nr:hypothetical protein [Burkholderiales bacterium]